MSMSPQEVQAFRNEQSRETQLFKAANAQLPRWTSVSRVVVLVTTIALTFTSFIVYLFGINEPNNWLLFMTLGASLAEIVTDIIVLAQPRTVTVIISLVFTVVAMGLNGTAWVFRIIHYSNCVGAAAGDSCEAFQTYLIAMIVVLALLLATSLARIFISALSMGHTKKREAMFRMAGASIPRFRVPSAFQPVMPRTPVPQPQPRTTVPQLQQRPQFQFRSKEPATLIDEVQDYMGEPVANRHSFTRSAAPPQRVPNKRMGTKAPLIVSDGLTLDFD